MTLLSHFEVPAPRLEMCLTHSVCCEVTQVESYLKACSPDSDVLSRIPSKAYLVECTHIAISGNTCLRCDLMAPAQPLQEVLPKAGLVVSEKGQLSEVLCKPKILPLKSVTLERIEKMEVKARTFGGPIAPDMNSPGVCCSNA